MITKAEQRLIDLQNFKKKVIKPFYDEYDRVLNEVIHKKGLTFGLPQPEEGVVKYVHMFSDKNGVGYQIEPCKGRYVVFSPFEVTNTRTSGEKKGLALKHLEGQGFAKIRVGEEVEMAVEKEPDEILKEFLTEEA